MILLRLTIPRVVSKNESYSSGKGVEKPCAAWVRNVRGVQTLILTISGPYVDAKSGYTICPQLRQMVEAYPVLDFHTLTLTPTVWEVSRNDPETRNL